MAFKPVDAESPVTPAQEMRDTIVKSSISGVAATVLAVTIWSPAGLGGMIGTSLASGSDTGAASNTVGHLAPFPTPITEVELADIQAKLRDSTNSLRALRASTNDEIAHMRAIAKRQGIAAPMGLRGHVGSGMDVTDALIAPAPLVAPSIQAVAPAVEPAAVETAAFAPATPTLRVSYDAPAAQLGGGAVVTYIGGDEYNSAPDPNMELASLLLAY